MLSVLKCTTYMTVLITTGNPIELQISAKPCGAIDVKTTFVPFAARHLKRTLIIAVAKYAVLLTDERGADFARSPA